MTNVREYTYVDVEVGVVDINAVGSLLEVDVANAVGANVVVLDGAEGHVGEGALDELGGSGNVVIILGVGEGVHHLGGGLVLGVLGHGGKAVRVDINAARAETRLLTGWKTSNAQGQSCREASKQKSVHGVCLQRIPASLERPN